VDFSRELVTAPGHRPNQVAVGAKGLARCQDLGLQAVLLDDPAGPDAAHQFVFVEHVAGVAMFSGDFRTIQSKARTCQTGPRIVAKEGGLASPSPVHRISLRE
jgi:hypothetical protein